VFVSIARQVSNFLVNATESSLRTAFGIIGTGLVGRGTEERLRESGPRETGQDFGYCFLI